MLFSFNTGSNKKPPDASPGTKVTFDSFYVSIFIVDAEAPVYIVAPLRFVPSQLKDAIGVFLEIRRGIESNRRDETSHRHRSWRYILRRWEAAKYRC
jgi:hypothetical protein